MIHYLTVVLFIIKVLSVLSQPYRLPNNLRPIRYVLTVEPNLKEDLFNGSVVIDLLVRESTNNIVLHARNLTIGERIKLVNENGVEIMVVGTSNNEENETYTIELESELKKNENYSLTIGSFHGSLLMEKMVGFYLGTYDDENGNERRFAVTDFEPADARQAFPCFDEPALKARFLINLIRSGEYISLSNEELETTKYLGNDRYQDTFKETIEMSTYLVAYTISDFQSTKISSGQRIFGRPELISQRQFSYTEGVSVEVLRALEDFTGINFTMRKMDLFAVPNKHFRASAMENWGLVTAKESYISCTNYSTIKAIQDDIKLISHEFAHQWFGNLVTMSWWDCVWLSEGFATYFQHFIPSKIRPSWRFMDQFVVDRMHSALFFDSYNSFENRSLNMQIEHMNASMQYIVYLKGGSIIRMAEHFLTHPVFKRGLNAYLESRKFATARPHHLFDAFQKAVNEANANYLLGNLTVPAILETWTNYPGYPVVNVKRNYETGSITFEQTRFQHEGRSNSTTETIWHVPITYAFQSNKPKFSKTTADFWLSEKNITINNNFNTNGWFLVNIKQTGFYRVNYDLENWERLIYFLRNDDFEVIPAVNRAQLVDDVFRLAEAKELPFDITFRLFEYLRREKDYLPIKAFLLNSYQISRHLETSYEEMKIQVPFFSNFSLHYNVSDKRVVRNMFQGYTVELLEGAYDYLGINEKLNDTHLDKLTRIDVVQISGRSHSKCRRDVLKKFEQLKKNNSTYIIPDLQHTVICQGAKTKEDKAFLKDMYLQTTDVELRKHIKSGLECYSRRLKAFKKEVLKMIVLPYFSVLKNLL